MPRCSFDAPRGRSSTPSSPDRAPRRTGHEADARDRQAEVPRARFWFRASSVVFAGWGVVFFFFPRFSNEFAGLGYVASGHAEDWTRIVGLFALAFAVLLHEARRSGSPVARRIVARAVLAVTLPCALLMTYWQIAPDRRWFRLDIANVVLLYAMSYGMFDAARTDKAEDPPQ